MSSFDLAFAFSPINNTRTTYPEDPDPYLTLIIDDHIAEIWYEDLFSTFIEILTGNYHLNQRVLYNAYDKCSQDIIVRRITK